MPVVEDTQRDREVNLASSGDIFAALKRIVVLGNANFAVDCPHIYLSAG